MSLKIIASDRAPSAIGPYSQAVQAGNMVFLSGQIALDPSTGELVQGDVVVQAERVMENIAAVLSATGAGFDEVVKTTIYLVEMGDFAAMNEVYGRYFQHHKPARSTVAVKSLPRGALVEIETVVSLTVEADRP